MFCIADDKNVVDIVDDICYSLIHHDININTNVIEIIFFPLKHLNKHVKQLCLRTNYFMLLIT